MLPKEMLEGSIVKQLKLGREMYRTGMVTEGNTIKQHYRKRMVGMVGGSDLAEYNLDSSMT